MNHDDILAILESEYRKNRAAGMLHRPAWMKARAQMWAKYPDAEKLGPMALSYRQHGIDTPQTREAHNLVSQMGTLSMRLKREYRNPPPATSEPAPTNGNGPTNGTGPTAHIAAYLAYLNPEPGEVITLNLHYLAWEAKKANDSAWRYVFSENGPLWRDGWRFETVTKSGKCYEVKVTEKPISERDRQIAGLQKQMAELQATLAALTKG